MATNLSRLSGEKCDKSYPLKMPERVFKAIKAAAYADDRDIGAFIRHRMSSLPEVKVFLQDTPRGQEQGVSAKDHPR